MNIMDITKEQEQQILSVMEEGSEWSIPVCTDPSCCQFRLNSFDTEAVYIFSQKETVSIDPLEHAYRTDLIDLRNYTEESKKSAVEAFGHEYEEEFDKDLLAEFLFELDYVEDM